MTVRHIIFQLSMCLLLSACAGFGSESRNVNRDKAAAVNVQLGSIYLQQGNLGAANDKLLKALEQNSDSAEAHGVYALLLSELKEDKKAEKHFKWALRIDPRNSAVLNNYGNFLCDRNRIDKAEEMFLAALLDPLYQTPEFAYSNAGACVLKVPDYKKASTYLRKALQRNKNLPSALYQMAKMYYLQGKYTSSVVYLDRYHQVAPKDPESLWLGLRLAWQLRDAETAANYKILLKNKYPDSLETQKLLQAEDASIRR